MRLSFFDTIFATQAGLAQQMPRVLKYVLENRHAVLSTSELVGMIAPIRSILKTPIAECFDRITAGGALTNFAAIFVPAKSSGVPESLSTASLTLDIRQMKEANVVKSVPELAGKVLANVTSSVRVDKTGEYTISSLDAFMSTFVRGQLVLSYNDSTNPNIAVADYVIKTYSMILSGLISRYYSLSMTDTMRVAACFAWYFSQQYCGDSDPYLFMHCTYLGSRRELDDLRKFFTDAYPGVMVNLAQTCELIAALGIDRMSTFVYAALQAMASNLGGDAITSNIALEYPPYWTYMLIQALSGTKIALVYQLNAHRLQKEGGSMWMRKVLSDSNMYEAR